MSCDDHMRSGSPAPVFARPCGLVWKSSPKHMLMEQSAVFLVEVGFEE